jgi:hypothetical protein
VEHCLGAQDLRRDVIGSVIQLNAFDSKMDMVVEVDDMGMRAEAPGRGMDVELPMGEAAWLLCEELSVVLVVEGDKEIFTEVRNYVEERLVDAGVVVDVLGHLSSVDLRTAAAQPDHRRLVGQPARHQA